jgi:hypothetical protein
MSGLYTRSNLSESGLNATDAVQKLYEPQVQQDLLLFAFASRLESQISSPSLVAENQIFALINEPISDSSGNIFLRTKFLTNGFTFSENNLVWLDRVNFPLDKRSSSETEGCSVIFSVNSSLTQVSLESRGEKYVVRDSSGALVSLPSTVQVRLRGAESGASNAVASVTVEQDGRLSRSVSLVTGGSNYIDGEFLEIVLGCREDETPTLHKCFVYTGSNYLDQVVFDQDGRSAQALLRSVKYTYTTRFSDGEGFFLYDDLEQKWMYLGSDYDQLSLISGSSPPLLSMKRLDTLSSDNMTQLFQLDGRSQFFDYGQTYQSGQSIGGSIRGLLNRAEELKDTFKYFVQNNRVNTPETSENNQLGTRFNIIDGKNILSDFRVIFRDPDGSIDQPASTFAALSGLDGPDTLRINGATIPGIWLFSGDKYKRVFSSDEKPFLFQQGLKTYSPAIFNPQTGNELAGSGSFKFSLSTAFAPSGQTTIRGFDVQLNTLVQNISTTAGGGGFVYHRQLSTQTVSGSVTSWPLFSYRDGLTIKDARLLAI